MSDSMETTYRADPGKRRLLSGMAGVLAAVPGLALLWGGPGVDFALN